MKKKSSIILGEQHHNQRVSVSPDSTIIVQLEENGSTGYLWQYEPLMTHRIECIDSTFIRHPGEEIGGPGTASMRFKLLVKSGEVKLWFNLLRPFEKGHAPIQTVIITLIVE